MNIDCDLMAKAEDIEGNIQLRIDGKATDILFCDIIFIESFGNYVKIATTSKTYLAQLTTKVIESLLPEEHFIRIHKSYIVNSHLITKIEHSVVAINSILLPIGKTYKQYFLKMVGKKFNASDRPT